jgi:hypothetical protein
MDDKQSRALHDRQGGFAHVHEHAESFKDFPSTFVLRDTTFGDGESESTFLLCKHCGALFKNAEVA